MNNQIGLPGIGQKKMTLSMWKKENNIYTLHLIDHEEVWNSWACWDEIENPLDFMEKYNNMAPGYGKTEKDAILDFCNKEEIKPPFWW